MGIFSGCLLASDIDETLLDSGKIPKANLDKIDYFLSEGGTFALATGRTAKAIEPIFKQLEISKVGPSVTTNGGVIYDFSKGKVLAEKVLLDSEKEIAKCVLKEMNNIGIEVHTTKEIYTLNLIPLGVEHVNYVGMEVKETDFDEIKDINWNKVLYLCNTMEDREKLTDLISCQHSESDFLNSSAIINGVQSYYYEQLPKNTSKGVGIRELGKICHIKKGGIFAIGDYYNDEAMLKEADISATTAGSPDDLKKIVQFVSSSAKEGAVATFIDYLKEKFS